MMVWLRTFFAATALYAADPPQVALAVKAEADFDAVQLAARPRLADTGSCVQSQAAALGLSTPEEAVRLYFRRGYCALEGAAITGNGAEYLAAAADFERATEAWPARNRKLGRQQAAEPVSSALRVLPWIARLGAGAAAPGVVSTVAARQGIAAALEAPSCASNLMPAGQCERILEAGREWLGWIALGEDRLDDAARYFAGAGGTGWPEWVEGQRQFRLGNYGAAALGMGRATAVWKAAVRGLGPAPDRAGALADLGGAQLLAGDARGAVAVLDEALGIDGANARALFRRGRAHELAGDAAAALADYGMASRAAFASAGEVGSGEAHLYRGILLYRRGDYARAEGEFASALNLQIAAGLRGDAQAWRHMAAMAGGTCGSEREYLEGALSGVSPFFPRQEARRLAGECGGRASAASTSSAAGH